MKRDVTIDIAKGIGIITVVWAHLTVACPIKEEIYWFHMPLFFLLSGYFHHQKNNDVSTFLKKKFKAYIIPYIFFFLLAEICFITIYTALGLSDKIFISPSIIIRPYGVLTPLWFFISIFWVSIIYFLICKYSKKESWIHILSIALALIGYTLYKFKIHIPLYIDSSISMVLFYHIGKSLNTHSFLNKSTSNTLWIMFASIVSLAIAAILNSRVDIMINQLGSNLFVYIMAALAGSLLTIIISKYLTYVPYISNIMAYLGRNTLSIFALHMLCFEIGRHLLGFPLLEESTYMDGIYMTIFAIASSLLIAIPLKRIVPFVYNR